MLKPEHLVTLREVVRVGSFAKAANRLGYTPSAISQQMSALEHEMGVVLFERTPRAVIPTEAALAVARRSSAVLTEIDRLVSAAGQAQEQSGRVLRVGSFPSFAMLVIPHLFGRLSPVSRRGLRVTVGEPSQLIPHLGSSGDLDVALVYQVGQAGLSWPASLQRHWIAEDPFVIAYPQCWQNTPVQPYSVTQFADLPWILNLPGSGDSSVLDGIFSRRELNPHVVARCDDFIATMRMVAAGVGAAPMPHLALLSGVPDGIDLVRASWLNLSRSITALIRPGIEGAALTLLLDTVAEIVQELQVPVV